MNARVVRKIALVLTIALIISGLGIQPVHAQGQGCQWGDLICELQQAAQQLINSYLPSLQNWLLLKLNSLVYGFVYNTLHQLADILWGLVKALITVGVGIGVLADWLSANLFQPLIASTNQLSSATLSGIFVIALAVLGCTYLLAAWVRLRVVNPRSAILWFIAGLVFFQIGPSLYASMADLRRAINSYFYAATLQAMAGQNPFQKLAADDPDANVGIYQMPKPCNNFPAYLSGASTINGLDIALAYLKADGYDVLSGGSACLGGGDPTDLPRAWYDNFGFFDLRVAPTVWDDPALTLDGALDFMRTAVQVAFAGVSRLVNSFPIVLFGIAEQLVALCLTIAQGLTFISFACAILFAFFVRTEPIAWAVVDQWVALIVQTFVIAMVQAMTLALYISAASTSSPLITLAVGIIGLVLMAILLWSGIKAIWSSFNRLFEAFGQATGGAIISTGQATQTVIGASAAAASLAVTGGASVLGGVNALASGSTWAQAAGISFGGSRALDSAAFSLARLPGLRDTALGEAANQFVEGSASRRVGESLFGPVGTAAVGPALLTDRNPGHAEVYVDEQGQVTWQQPMLRPQVVGGMETVLTGPTWEPGEQSTVGGGGRVLRSEDGEPFQREDIQDEAATKAKRQATFTPVATSGAQTISLNNDGNLDETLNDDFKRDLAASGRPGESLLHTAGQRLETSAGKLDAAAGNAGDALSRSADALGRSVRATDSQKRLEQIEGRLNLSGAGNVAAVLSNAIADIQAQNARDGRVGADTQTVAHAMANVMGITPVEVDGKLVQPIQRNIARFQMFADQALQMGLSGPDTATVIREIKANPDGHLSPQTREELIAQQREQGHSWQDSVSHVQHLEHTARILPGEIHAYGRKTVAVSPETPPIVAAPSTESDRTPVVFAAQVDSSTSEQKGDSNR